MANETGGAFFYLKEISDLSDLLIGICLKDLAAFRKGVPPGDDLTIMAVRRSAAS